MKRLSASTAFRNPEKREHWEYIRRLARADYDQYIRCSIVAKRRLSLRGRKSRVIDEAQLSLQRWYLDDKNWEGRTLAKRLQGYKWWLYDYAKGYTKQQWKAEIDKLPF